MFNVRDLKSGEEILGVYTAQFRSVGAFKKTLHEFQIIGEKKKTHMWGSALLNHLLWGVPFGTIVKIKYFGKKETADSRGHQIHIYDVEIPEIEKLLARSPEFERLPEEKKLDELPPL